MSGTQPPGSLSRLGNLIRPLRAWCDTPQAQRAGLVLLRVLQLAFVLAPAVLAWNLVDDNRVNTLFLDDWVYVPLYEKFKLGQLTMHDLFGGYLEHRPAIIRMVNIALTFLSGGDMSWQCVGAFVSIALTWLSLGWLLHRALGGWNRLWLPWGLLGWVMYCPVQWHGYLWPACMLESFPMMFFSFALVLLGAERVPFWVRFAGCAFCAWLATYSYTPGLILWGLVPLGVACGYGIGEVAARKRFLIAWLVPMGVVVICYFHGLENEVEPVFAYGQGVGDTATHSIAAVLRAPDKGVRFALSLVGSNFSRGVFGPRWNVALYLGLAVFLLFLMAAFALVRRWSNVRLRQRVLPFALTACFGLGVGCMVAAGRAWASSDVGGALNNRYACFSCAFIAGVAGMMTVLRRASKDDPTVAGGSSRKVGCVAWTSWLTKPAAGAMCGLLVANWCYGAEMMQAWRYARLRGAVDIHFTPLLGQEQDRGRSGVQVRLAAERAATLNRMGLLHPPQATTLDLDQFTKRGKLDLKLGRITGTDRRSATIEVSGYALLTMHGRPCDAVLLTARTGDSPQRRIIDVSLPDNLPAFLLLDASKDFHFLVFDTHRPRRCGQWTATVKRESLPKGGKVRIEAWALNFENQSVFEIDEGFTIDN